MSNQTDVKLGTNPAEGAQRDAIHVAVLPIKAGCPLRPGEHVGVRDGMAYTSNQPVGIVDPFRKVDVGTGERFWLLLYQGSIVGMRHCWSHPAVVDEPPQKSHAPASEAWLRDFANKHYEGDYHALIERAKTGNVCFGSDDYPSGDEEVFWAHFNAVTGRADAVGYFRCAC